MNQRRRALTVLIVEDSLPVRQAFRSAFQAIPGVRVIGEAEDASEAVRLIRNARPEVVLLDLKLHEGYGTDVLRTVARDRSGASPVMIMLTNHTSSFLRAACLDLGASHFFDKAVEFGRLCDLLAGMAAARQRGERHHG